MRAEQRRIKSAAAAAAGAQPSQLLLVPNRREQLGSIQQLCIRAAVGHIEWDSYMLLYQRTQCLPGALLLISDAIIGRGRPGGRGRGGGGGVCSVQLTIQSDARTHRTVCDKNTWV